MEEVILTRKCKEGNNIVERRVRYVEPDLPTILDLHFKMRKVANFLPERNPLGVFLREDTEVYLVDDVGVLVAVAIKPGVNAHAHMTFWDRRLRGRERLVHDAGQYVMWKHDLKTLWTAVPKNAKGVLAFTKRAGFEPFYEDESVIGLQLNRRS